MFAYCALYLSKKKQVVTKWEIVVIYLRVQS